VHSREIIGKQVHLFPGLIERRVPQNLLKMEDRPTIPEIRKGKRVAESVKGTLRSHDADPLAEELHVPEHDPALESVSIAGAEHEIELCLLLQDVQTAAKLKRERHLPFLATLPVVEHQQVVEVDLIPAKSERLADPAARIDQSEDERMEPDRSPSRLSTGRSS
jgi:hypothetical protein